MKILWEEEGFQFGFKRWQGWAMSKVLWEWIPNDCGVQSKRRCESICIAGFPACGCQKEKRGKKHPQLAKDTFLPLCVHFLCLLLFRYLFHLHVTAVAHKRSWSFCQKCRWQVTATYSYTLRMWLCMKWHGAWLCGVHRTCAKMAAVSCGTSHASTVSTPLRWIFKNVL